MRVVLALAAFGLAGCGELGMHRQPRYAPQGVAASLPHTTESQEAPIGVVAVGQPQVESQAVTPPPVTLALVQRGRERYGVACAPCHGSRADGDGEVVARGFPAPPSFAERHVSALSGRQIYDVITDGYGVMAPQAERVAPADRWAIVSYVRALDLARSQQKPAA